MTQYWHPGVPVNGRDDPGFDLGGLADLRLSQKAELRNERGGQFGWLRAVYGTKVEADCITATVPGELPITMSAEIAFKRV